MTTLKVKDREYKIKFGYKSFKNSGILREVVSMQKKTKEAKDADDETVDNIDLLEDVLDLNSKLVLVGLQKYNEEFRVDFEDEKATEKMIDKVDDLMDDYMDEEDSMSIMDLFGELTGELFENGFLSKKSKSLEENLEKQDATIVPIDHRQSEN